MKHWCLFKLILMYTAEKEKNFLRSSVLKIYVLYCTRPYRQSGASGNFLKFSFKLYIDPVYWMISFWVTLFVAYLHVILRKSSMAVPPYELLLISKWSLEFFFTRPVALVEEEAYLVTFWRLLIVLNMCYNVTS